MYQTHWGLRVDPFRTCVDPRRYFRSPAADEALARLQFLIDGAWRFGLLLGPAGTGKSLLLEVFARELQRQRVQVANVALRGLEPIEALWQIALALGLCPNASDGNTVLWRRITDRLIENRYQQLNTVVMLDDLDRAATGMLEQVARLLQCEPTGSARLSVVATGDGTHLNRLGRLLELVDLRIDLAAWSLEDTEEYLTSALARAGGKHSIFAPAAIERLHDLAHGIPRRVNHLAEMAILAGAVSELREIDAHTIDVVDGELGFPTSQMAGAQF